MLINLFRTFILILPLLAQSRLVMALIMEYKLTIDHQTFVRHITYISFIYNGEHIQQHIHDQTSTLNIKPYMVDFHS
jgi:hypothetical protein